MPVEEGRLIPALPETDPERGEIRWGRWEPALTLSHFDPSCSTCGHPGPQATCVGQTLYAPAPTWKRVERSNWAKGRRSQWARVQLEAWWAYTHFAVRCPRCAEMTAWRHAAAGEWVEIHYRPPTVEEVPARGAAPGQEPLF